MNEKIKLLAEQAHLYNDDDTFLIAALENFAELIVKECADLFTRTHTDDQYQRRIDKTIRKHFGFEE